MSHVTFDHHPPLPTFSKTTTNIASLPPAQEESTPPWKEQ
jgi:hypothetical protein